MAVFYKAMFGKLVELAKLISPAKPSDPVNVRYKLKYLQMISFYFSYHFINYNLLS